jgi:NAD(P)-dependent dehydrogenase (short-subunit alcohol dehydrogenase family)
MAALTGRRVLLLGAETELGANVASDLAKADAVLALVAASREANAAFAAQRLARRIGALSQAIEATNEAAVRVMVRQVSKDLGGIDSAVSCVDDPIAAELFERHARREMKRMGEGVFVDGTAVKDVAAAIAEGLSES